MFIVSNRSSSGSVRKSGKVILLDSNEGRSSEQSRVTELLRAINIALLRSEERTAQEAKASRNHSQTLARGSEAYRACY